MAVLAVPLVERVQGGASILGLHRMTDKGHCEDFDSWKEAKKLSLK